MIRIFLISVLFGIVDTTPCVVTCKYSVEQVDS
jgi:hypothetical protein